jgi:hypothetical protein
MRRERREETGHLRRAAGRADRDGRTVAREDEKLRRSLAGGAPIFVERHRILPREAGFYPVARACPGSVFGVSATNHRRAIDKIKEDVDVVPRRHARMTDRPAAGKEEASR